MSRQFIRTGVYPAPVPGFSQAVAVDTPARWIFVSGVTARTPEGAISGDDLASQTRQVYENLEAILAEAGAGLDDIVRIVTYLRDMDDYESMRKVRHSFLPDDAPASTTIEVARLFDRRLLIEVEATAVTIGSERPSDTPSGSRTTGGSEARPRD